ncbi:MAG: hypothetical protein C5B59_07110 [Bacteroidetes bacterium]|nr:MAG: hypothetical protein C5B59_07110 [Bacteroidota bacterium]
MAYKRRNYEFEKRCQDIADGKVITVTIDEEGDQVFLKGHGADVFKEIGETKTQRASHVEPDNAVLRLVFHAVRSLVSDASRIAAWTRTWRCLWRVNTKPTAGYILPQRWRNRQEAINAEISFLNNWFVEGENAIQACERQKG